MDRDLARRIRKAKRAQAKRSLSLSNGKKKCKIGKSCGATCIARHEICAVEMEEGISQDLGKVSKEVSRSKKPNQPKEDALAVSFSNHIKENSFAIPGRSVSSKDLAEMVNAAASALSGESKENMDKLRQFAIRDKQGVFISTNSDDKTLDLKSPLPWRSSKEYLENRERFLSKRAIEKILSSEKAAIGNAKFFLEEMEKSVKWVTDKIEETGPQGWVKFGYMLDEAEKNLREARLDMVKAENHAARFIIPRPGISGFTTSESRAVFIMNNQNYSTSNQKVDGKQIQYSIAEIIGKRAKANRNSREGDLEGTNSFHSRSLNGLVVTYVHELGHQVHYRAGHEEPTPPSNSVSLGRSFAKGITDYSTVSGAEAFAEAFVAFVFNPSALRSHDEPLYDWVRVTFDEALSKAGANLP